MSDVGVGVVVSGLGLIRLDVFRLEELGLDPQAVLQRLDDVGAGDELGDRRQLGERVEAEPFRGTARWCPNSTAWPGPGSRATSSM